MNKELKKLYAELIKEYNENQWSKICGLDRFLKSKYESETNPTREQKLYEVIIFAENDY
jgi:dsRNA-specific ribonuclease